MQYALAPHCFCYIVFTVSVLKIVNCKHEVLSEVCEVIFGLWITLIYVKRRMFSLSCNHSIETSLLKYIFVYIILVYSLFFLIFAWGRLGVPFLHLFVYICWSHRIISLMLCYHSIAPSTYKDDISASAICHL